MNNPYFQKFGRQLKECRRLAKSTQEELAAYIDKDPSLISHYERGDNLPDRRRLFDMVLFFRERGVSNDSLEQLYEYSGYDMAQEHKIPILNQIISLMDVLENEPFSKNLFEESLQAVVDDWKKYANALRDLRRSYFQDAKEGFSELISTIDQELPLRRRLSIRIYQGLANTWRYLGEPINGLEYLNKALIMAEESGEPEKETLASLLIDRGNFYRRLNEWDKAKNDYINSYHIYKRIERATSESKDRFIAIVERKMAGTLLFQGEPQKAIEHCNHSINICKELSDMEQECKGLQHKAWALAMLGHWDEALEIHNEVIKSLAGLGVSLISMSKGYRYLADTYRMCGILDKAEASYNEALNYLQKLLKSKGEFEGDYIIFGTILLGMGSIYRRSDSKRDQAKYFLDKSLKSHIQLGAKLHEALTRSELGRLAIDTRDFRQAKYELEKARDIFSELDNKYYFVAQLINLAELEYYGKNYSTARALAASAITISEKQGFDVHIIRAKLRLAEINLISPDEQDPFDLYLSAVQKARELNPFLLHEILSRIIGQPHVLHNEDNVIDRNILLSRTILREVDQLFKYVPSSRPSLQKLLDEINHTQGGLEQFENISPFVCGHALLIGIGTYQQLNRLTKTTTDAKDLHDLLAQNEYRPSNLTLLLDERATKGAIGNELDLLARRAAPQDTVVIFFSGHGAQRVRGFEQGEYLCPVETDWNNLKTTAISNNDLTTAIKAIPARQVVVFLDACHSGGVGAPKSSTSSTKAGLSEDTYDQLASSEGRVVIASCKPNEVSWELADMRNGLFTHYLLEGLRGAAFGNTGLVGILNLFDYISRLVPTRASQHPMFKGEVDYNFPIVPRFSQQNRNSV